MRKMIIAMTVVVTSVGAVGAQVGAAAPAVTVPGPADLVVDADWTPVLGDVVDMNSVNCRDGATTHKSVNDLETALSSNPVRLLNVVSLECKPTLAVEGKVVNITGTAKSDSLGFSDGVFKLKCSFRANLSITVSIEAGLKAPHLQSPQTRPKRTPLPTFGEPTGVPHRAYSNAEIQEILDREDIEQLKRAWGTTDEAP